MQSPAHTMTKNEKAQFVACIPEGRATYEIGIAGQIMHNWRDYLDATSVTYVTNSHQAITTVLTCEVLDQAHLIGILNMLNTWGTRLIWLDCIHAGVRPN
jgi:hypothetical protein